MNPLLEQFLSEARDFLQGIGEKLMQLEKAPSEVSLMTELFRYVHTLKGNSGLFDFPEMTRVLHAGEDLLDGVRHGNVVYSRELADHLLDAMDFVGMLCDEIETNGSISANYVSDSARLTDSLRKLIVRVEVAGVSGVTDESPVSKEPGSVSNQASQTCALIVGIAPAELANISEQIRMRGYRDALQGGSLHWLVYAPDEACFFQGEDPFFQARNTPELLWGSIVAREAWPNLTEMDAYRCLLDYQILSSAPREMLEQHYRYVADQIIIQTILPLSLIIPCGDPNGGPVYEDFVSDALALVHAGDLAGLARAAETMLALSSPDLWLSSALRWLLLVQELQPDNTQVLLAIIESLRSLTPSDWLELQTHWQSPLASPAPARIAIKVANPPETDLAQIASPIAEEMRAIIAIQHNVLSMPVDEPWQLGRMQAAAAALVACLRASARLDLLPTLELAIEQAVNLSETTPLLQWVAAELDAFIDGIALESITSPAPQSPAARVELPVIRSSNVVTDSDSNPELPEEFKFGRRAEDSIVGPKSLKVDQVKIDRLMNLIGEMVVSKNALPYLAGRAETVFGVRELSREIKAQYAVINRIAEEMQDAIMQVRMMPVSFVFQRFPRLVRDISRKLGKDINLVLEGEDTEADKNIIESLGDPLVHIVRNSLDHGFELPEVRAAVGKPATGTLIIRATQESDRAIIEISDDGKGIDPEVIKRKAYEKGILDEAGLERISDQEAVNLVFAPGFSTAEVISDLSGRGVGMDVVRTAVEKVNGTISLESEKGKGTRIRLALPLSMAVTNVMLIESDGQAFGVPMDSVVETVRVPRNNILAIKHSLATVLRGRIVPLKSLNSLLAISSPPQANDDDELAILVVRLGDDVIGLLVDDFRETIDIILKPMAGVLGGIPGYAGSALMGDGSVLMVLDIKELLA